VPTESRQWGVGEIAATIASPTASQTIMPRYTFQKNMAGWPGRPGLLLRNPVRLPPTVTLSHVSRDPFGAGQHVLAGQPFL
jgi:hypothetical protein